MQRHLPLLISVAAAVCLVGGAIALANREEPTGPRKIGTKKFTAKELAAFDGQDGRACYVAVKKTVYEIAQGRLWNEGKHATSGGKAECGRDLTAVITQSPHGTSKLKSLDIVGTLESASRP
jgi:predicted heme/steroid binding protein